MPRLLRTYGGVVALSAALIVFSAFAAMRGEDRHQQLVREFGFDLDALRHFRIWVLAASPFVQGDPGFDIRVAMLLVLAIFAIVLLARMAGQVWAIAIFFGTHAISSFLTLGCLALLAQTGSTEAEDLLHVPDTGVSACAYGALAAAFMMFGARLRTVAITGLVCWLIFSFSYYRLDIAIAHALAAISGGLIVLMRSASRRTAEPVRSSGSV